MDKLYELILHGLQDKSNHENLSIYLQSLKTHVKKLRNSYRNTLIKVDYSDRDTQAAYLISYFPHYAEMTYDLLKRLTKEEKLIFQTKQLQVCLFGAGPIPEVVGLVSFIGNDYPAIESIIINAYDIAADTWQFSQDIIKYDVIPYLWKGELTLNNKAIDMCRSNEFKKIEKVIASNHLFIFQNCINELNNIDIFLENIKFIIQNNSQNSLTLMADLKYQNNFNTIDKVQKYIEHLNEYENQNYNRLKIIERREKEINLKTSLKLPFEIRSNLLIGEYGLIPRTQVKYGFLTALKINANQKHIQNCFTIFC